MKKIAVFVLTMALLPLVSQAKVIFACEGTSKILNPGAKTHFRLSQAADKTFTLEKDGVPAQNGPNETIISMEPNLDGLGDYLKCKDGDDLCREKVAKGKDKGFSDFGGIIAIAQSSEKDKNMPKNTNTLAKLKVSDIKSGKAYIFGEKDKISKFGNMGVYEVYDKSGKILGRYIYAVEIMDCSNQEKPSSAQSGSGATKAKTSSTAQ